MKRRRYVARHRDLPFVLRLIIDRIAETMQALGRFADAALVEFSEAALRGERP